MIVRENHQQRLSLNKVHEPRNAESLYLCGFSAFVLSNGSSLALFVGRVMYNYYRADADGHIREHRIIIGAM